MMAWLIGNVGTVIVVLILLAVAAAAAAVIVHDRKKGKSFCGCNCAGCAMSGSCHRGKQPVSVGCPDACQAKKQDSKQEDC